MKKSIPFYLTVWVIKVMMKLMKLLGRRGTYLPGVIALKMCPSLMSMMKLPKKIVCITGTNGKTTCANMISDFLTSENISYMHNKYGSNTVEGIAASLIQFSNLRGDVNYDYGIIEVDERSSYRVYKHMTPDFLVVTNLFRDSSKRNAHADYIFDIIEDALPDSTKLILNADDLISSALKKNSHRVFYSMDLLSGEREIRDSRIKDIENCPICNHRLEPEFIRYNHIGRYHCSNCSFKSPDAQYVLKDINLEKEEAYIEYNGQLRTFHLQSKNIVDIYNLLTSITTLHELGFSMEELSSKFKNIEVVKSRYNDRMINGTRLVYMMAKAINPISASRTFDYIRKQKGKITIVFGNSKFDIGYMNSENTAWLYDLDFKYLLETDEVVQYITCGKRYKDFEVALLLSGVPKEKITSVPGWDQVSNVVDYDNVDTIFVLNDIDTLDFTGKVLKEIEGKLLAREGNK